MRREAHSGCEQRGFQLSGVLICNHQRRDQATQSDKNRQGGSVRTGRVGFQLRLGFSHFALLVGGLCVNVRIGRIGLCVSRIFLCPKMDE